MRYIFIFAVALASCGSAEPVKRQTQKLLRFNIESNDDYDIVSISSNKHLLAEITEVSIKNPVIYPYNSEGSAIVITDIVAEDNYYKIAQYVKLSSSKGRLLYIYNCRADLDNAEKVDYNNDEYKDYFRKMVWNEKLKKLKVVNEVCKVAEPINPGGNTF